MNLPTEDEIIDFTLKTLSINEFRKIDTKAIKLNFDLGKEHTVFVNNSLERAFRKDLIIFGGNSHSNAKLKEFGETVLTNGGWLKHLACEVLKKEKTEQKEDLETELKTLQKESLEYLKTIREQSDRIRNLDEQIKILSLLKQYWWFIGICITFGVYLKDILEIFGLKS